MANFKAANRMSQRAKQNMNQLLELISTGTNDDLKHEANMFKLRNAFAGRDSAQISAPRQHHNKYKVDDTLMSKNARLSQGVHRDNQHHPDLITGSLDALFNSDSQRGRSSGDFDKDPRRFRA